MSSSSHPRVLRVMTPKETAAHAADDLPQRVVRVTTEFLHVTGVEGTVMCRDWRSEESPSLWVEILSPESRLLIGERGATLQALEHVLRLVLRPVVGEDLRVMVDVNAYRARRDEVLRQKARAAARRARQQGRAVVLEPMHASERRTVHLTLAGEEGIVTESQGEDPHRRVIIRPTDSLV